MKTLVPPSPVIWIAGLSQSGKTTIANGLADWILGFDLTVQVLDGSVVRDEVGNFFGYSREQRIKVSRLLAVIAKLLSNNGVSVIVTSITPYQESRDLNRTLLPSYFEIYLECSVDACMARDKSGMYAKAQRGDLRHFIGIDDPFEYPRNCDLKINTGDRSPEQALADAQRALGEFLNS